MPSDRQRAADDEQDDGTGHDRRRRAAAANKKAAKLNVIPFNGQAQRVLAEFLHVTEGGQQVGEEVGAEEEEELRSLLDLLKTA